MEARAAISIATSVQADKRAESEFRQARVALDTMEELVRRASAPDVVSAAAHAAIRRAQTATTAGSSKRSIERFNPRNDLSNVEILHTAACCLDQAVPLGFDRKNRIRKSPGIAWWYKDTVDS